MESAFNKITSIHNPIDLDEYLTSNTQLNLIPMKDKFQANLLHFCAFHNLFENMKVIIKHVKQYYDSNSSVVTTRYDRTQQFKLNLTAWIDQANHEGDLPLHYACLHGNVQMIKYLEELGGNLLYKNNNGENLIHMCAVNNQVTPLLYLYGKNLNFNEENKDGDTPLFKAAANGSIDVVSLLVTLPEVKINKANVNKETPLMIAVKENQPEVIKRLLIKGADRHLRNNEQKNAYEIALERNDRKIARILSQKRSFIDRIKILCNKKTVYRPEQPNLLLVFGFLFLFLTSTIPTNVVIQLPLADIVVTALFYIIYLVLYISLLFKPSKRQPQPLKQLSPPFCPECRTKKLPQSYHCFLCKTCIYRYDHHCPWINNCVGWHNIGRFTWFLFLTIIALLETIVLTIYEGIILKHYRFSFGSSEAVFLILHIYTLLVALFIYPLCNLLFAQLKTLMLNKTGYQRHRSSPKKKNKKESLLDDSVRSETQNQAEDEDGEDCTFSNCILMYKQNPQQPNDE